MFIISRKRISLILICFLIGISVYSYQGIKTGTQERVEETIEEATATPVSGKVVVLDAGHGTPDEGAQSSKGTTEAETNLKIALKVQNLLEQSGCTVILTRSDEKAIYDLDKTTLKEKKISDIRNRVKIGNSASADMFVSIHLNKIPQQQYWGWQCFYCINREEIIHYLQSIQQEYVTDSTNLEDEYTRNKIRLNLLPLMQTINPSVKNNLIETSNYLNDVATLYNKYIEEAKTKIITAEGIRISSLLKEPAPEAILFEVFHPLGFNSTQIKDIASSLHSQPGKQFCCKEWRIIKDREFLLLEAVQSVSKATPPFQLIREEQEYTSDFQIPQEKQTACFDADKLNEEICCRKWQTGDTFVPFGMKGKKKISDYLTDRKFSISQKERQWVLCCGERIAWLIGERTDNRFRIDETTKRVIIYRMV